MFIKLHCNKVVYNTAYITIKIKRATTWWQFIFYLFDKKPFYAKTAEGN